MQYILSKIVKPKLNEVTILKDKKFEVQNNKIITYPNERIVYYALCNLESNLFKVKKDYNVIQEPLELLLNNGYSLDLEELVRDFDGWAWNVIVDDITNYSYNLVYQNIVPY